MTNSLFVFPQFITVHEDHPDIYFFCQEGDGIFAINIVWQDPQEYYYVPGSPNEGVNKRISAEGSRLSILNISRNDTGVYRCLRSNNYTVFAEGSLTVTGVKSLLY